jgi:hypothetical protein
MKTLRYIALAIVLTMVSGVAWSGRGGHGFHGHGAFVGHGQFIAHRPFFVHRPFFAHPRFSTSFGVFIGAPLFVGPPLVYASPPVVYASPPAYVEQSTPATSSYWYFCPDSKTYYPYVQECPSGWLRVVPGSSGPAGY